jgi:hypothetical protein
MNLGSGRSLFRRTSDVTEPAVWAKQHYQAMYRPVNAARYEAIARCPGAPGDLEIADWLVQKGFARHQDLVRDNAFGGISSTDEVRAIVTPMFARREI